MEVDEMDQLKDHLAVAQKSLDVDTPVHIQKTTLKLEAQPHWHLIIATVPASSRYCWSLVSSAQNFGVPHRADRARLSPQKMVRTGPRHILSLFPKPDSHGLFGTTVRKFHFRHIRSEPQETATSQ
jgi:hypothetical protein